MLRCQVKKSEVGTCKSKSGTRSGGHGNPRCSRRHPERIVSATRLEVAGLTDVGTTRRGRPNEDSFTVIGPDGPTALLAVADGMGGAAAGDRASALAVKAVGQFRQELDTPQALEEIFTAANQAVWNFQRWEPGSRGAGTTLVAAFLAGDDLWISNVGDSRAYRLRDGHLEQLTEDHSLVQEDVRAGRLAPEEARNHRRSNIITRNIGGGPEVEVDVGHWDLRAGDVVLLCSDGLSGPLTDSAIRDIILNRHGNPLSSARALIDAANAAGGPDNVTVVIARVGGTDSGSTAPPQVAEAKDDESV